MEHSPSVLIVDDDRAFRFALRKALRRLGYEVSEASSGDEALTELRKSNPADVALLDLRMEGLGGLDVLRRRGAAPTRIIVLTGHGTVQAAVEAMQLGAFSFLEKPVDAEVLGPLLRQAVKESPPQTDGDGPTPLIGVSKAMDDVREFIARVGPTDEIVAILGETGTGKEVVARQIHHESARSGSFVALNAACVPENLFESELFGHKKGAFTGATSDRAGLFRNADGGTLFLDEVAELPFELQAKLLRALEARKIRPVGASAEVSVDARIVAATNRSLWSEVQAGRFREDLYFRLQVFPLVLPPLRQRKEDIEPLAEHLLGRVGSGAQLTDGAKKALRNHDWPGNVRELLNVLRRASLFAGGDLIEGDLAGRMIAASVFARGERPEPVAELDTGRPSRLADVERAHIERVLREMKGNITRTASALGIDRRTLQRKLKGYGLSGDE
ncbi:MAG: sigma-54 dependent transcriptional regulator [Myxococcota bacterium]